MKKFILLLSFVLLSSSTAHAKPPARADLGVTVTAPSGVAPYSAGRTQVTVSNAGPQTASAARVSIALPQTATSPTRHVLGTLVASDSRCTLSGTTLTCALGNLRRNSSTTVWFDGAFAHATTPLTVAATASSSTSDPSPGNDTATATATLSYPLSTVVPGDAAVVEHCTGTGLTSFFECELYPSSISSHEIEFQSGGTLVFTNPSGTSYHGTWTQSPDASHLSMQYFDGATLTATFVGRAVNGSCFEGVTTFPGSSYNSPYSVCR